MSLEHFQRLNSVPQTPTSPRSDFGNCFTLPDEAAISNLPHLLRATIPDEIWLIIFSHLGPEDLVNVLGVCRLFRCLGMDSLLWSNLYRNMFDAEPAIPSELCRRFVYSRYRQLITYF